MNFTRRRASIVTFITLGVLLTGLAIFLSIPWIILNKARAAYLILGIIFFAILIAGLVLNTIFLVREVRRNERQDSFVNAVTHELKTPSPASAFTSTLYSGERCPKSNGKKFYSIMHDDSDRLIATVESVLKAGELGQRSRQHNRTVVDLAPLVADCVAITLARHHLPSEAIALAPIPGQIRLRVSGIPDDLRTAILNLLDNAVKYSPDGPAIRCALAITDYRFVSLSIIDHGLGIPPAELKRIFKRFYRIGGHYEIKIKGTGLGLFLVRTIARQHGGSITAASPGPHQGTTLTLTLPLADTHA